MSKPRYDWWPYVKGMIRRYPQMKTEYDELHTQSMVADYSGMPKGGSGGACRAVEGLALRELPRTQQREYEAVRQAIAMTERYQNGGARLQVIDLVLWKHSHTLEGAALSVPCSWRLAAQWHGEFIKLVARVYGLLDE